MLLRGEIKTKKCSFWQFPYLMTLVDCVKRVEGKCLRRDSVSRIKFLKFAKEGDQKNRGGS